MQYGGVFPFGSLTPLGSSQLPSPNPRALKEEHCETQFPKSEPCYNNCKLNTGDHNFSHVAVAPARQAHLRDIAPPPFDENLPIRIWFEQFESAAEINGWPALYQAHALISLLPRSLQYLVFSMPKHIRESISDLKETLLKHCGSDQDAFKFRASVDAFRFGVEESFRQGYTRLKALLQFAYTNDTDLEYYGGRAYLRGVRDTRLREALIALTDHSLDRLHAAAARIYDCQQEFGASASRFREYNRAPVSFDDSGAGVGSSSTRPSTGRSTVVCYSCGQEGHMSRFCQTKPRSFQGNGAPPSHLRQ